MPKCIELLPCDWMISNLCYQAIERVYLIKWPVSVYIYVCVCIYIYICICMYLYMYMYMHVFIYIYIYVCVRVCVSHVTTRAQSPAAILMDILHDRCFWWWLGGCVLRADHESEPSYTHTHVFTARVHWPSLLITYDTSPSVSHLYMT